MIAERGIGRSLREMKVLLTHNRRFAAFDERAFTTLKLFLHGFRKDTKKLYSIGDLAELGDYLSHVEQRHANKLSRRAYREILNDKTTFPLLFPGTGVDVPENFLVLKDGTCFDLRHGWRVADLADVVRDIRAPIVVKPVAGLQARGVCVVAVRNEQIVLDEMPIEPGDLMRHFGNDIYVGCRFIRQHPVIAGLFPSSTNTLKIQTFYDEEAQRANVLCTVIRIGTRKSQPVDNPMRGGICAHVDPETGTLSKAIAHKTPAAQAKGKVLRLERHPDTGARIEGVVVPNWEGVKQGMLDFCQRFPFLECVGWDVVVTEDGFTILEGNPASDFDLFQMHTPLLRDDAFRRFVERKGIKNRRPLAPYVR